MTDSTVRGEAALALRDAPCNEKAKLLERVAREGDVRAQMQMDALRPPTCETRGGCCLDLDPRYSSAMRELSQRVRKSNAP